MDEYGKSSADWYIIKFDEHYHVYVKGQFYCSADTISEAVNEIELLNEEEYTDEQIN